MQEMEAETADPKRFCPSLQGWGYESHSSPRAQSDELHEVLPER